MRYLRRKFMLGAGAEAWATYQDRGCGKMISFALTLWMRVAKN